MNEFITFYIAIYMLILVFALAYFLITEALTTWRNGKVNRMYTIMEMNKKEKESDD